MIAAIDAKFAREGQKPEKGKFSQQQRKGVICILQMGNPFVTTARELVTSLVILACKVMWSRGPSSPD